LHLFVIQNIDMSQRSPRVESIVARSACRVDFAGGTVDLWPLYLFHFKPVVVNVAIGIGTTCRITPLNGQQIVLRSLDTGKTDTYQNFKALMAAPRHNHALAAYLVRFFEPESGFEIETHSESPAGAGISGSSALMIATTAALAEFTGRKLQKPQIREIAQNVEAQLIKVPTGCQDYFPALYGGVSALHLREDGIHREGIAVSKDEMESRFVLAYTGAPRQSGINNWEVFKAHIDGDKKVFKNFERITEIAHGMHAAFKASDWHAVGELLREEWKLRKTNAPKITTPMVDRLIEASNRNGGIAAKACGAGGGGCIVFFTHPESKRQVEKAIAKAGGTVLPFKVERRGVTVKRVKQ
jgi:D-glycero-alpha-D-manno-heptose-7-phosphate kinase